MLRAFFVIFLLITFVTASAAQDAKKKWDPEKIPAPKKLAPVIPVFPPYQRQDTMEVWQHYRVGPLGRFVPRVIVTPYGPLYSRNLEPYPWMQNRTSAIMPYAVD